LYSVQQQQRQREWFQQSSQYIRIDDNEDDHDHGFLKQRKRHFIEPYQRLSHCVPDELLQSSRPSRKRRLGNVPLSTTSSSALPRSSIHHMLEREQQQEQQQAPLEKAPEDEEEFPEDEEEDDDEEEVEDYVADYYASDDDGGNDDADDDAYF
jgi:hypothetical protein